MHSGSVLGCAPRGEFSWQIFWPRCYQQVLGATCKLYNKRWMKPHHLQNPLPFQIWGDERNSISPLELLFPPFCYLGLWSLGRCFRKGVQIKWEGLETPSEAFRLEACLEGRSSLDGIVSSALPTSYNRANSGPHWDLGCETAGLGKLCSIAGFQPGLHSKSLCQKQDPQAKQRNITSLSLDKSKTSKRHEVQLPWHCAVPLIR